MIEKLKEWSGVIVLLAILLTWIVPSPSEMNLAGNGSRFPNGISADSTSPIDGEVRGTTYTFTSTGTITGVATFTAAPVFNGGQLRSYTNSTSTVASMTLRESDILNYDTVLVTPTGAAASKTFTFPATSTLTSLVPTAGDLAEQCWYNATSTAATTLIFAAGTGIDLETASSTQTDLTLSASGSACFVYLRKPDTDISVLMLEYNNAD